eukprot:798020-Prorocentrum_minimum.AAC.1
MRKRRRRRRKGAVGVAPGGLRLRAALLPVPQRLHRLLAAELELHAGLTQHPRGGLLRRFHRLLDAALLDHLPGGGGGRRSE